MCIPIGISGENDAVTIAFDFHEWRQKYGADGTLLLIIDHGGEYIRHSLHQVGATAYFTLTADIGLTEGYTEGQLLYVVGDPGQNQRRKLSPIFRLKVGRAI